MNTVTILTFAGLLGTLGLALVVAAVRTRRTDPVALLAAEFEGDHSAALDDYQRALETNIVSRLFGPMAAALAGGAQRLLPANALESARARLVQAGLTHVTAEDFLVLRALGALGGAAFAVVISVAIGGAQGIAAAALAVFIGLAMPRAFVERARGERVAAVERELPDALDLLAISVEAGLGFEQALAVVADRSGSVLAEEFGHSLREMQLGRSRVQALHELQRRVDVPDLDSLVLALVQADALGMPMTRILRTQSAELRRRRRQRVRETAAKLPVKMLFPLVLFILPALFIVVLGPAGIQMARTF